MFNAIKLKLIGKKRKKLFKVNGVEMAVEMVD